MATIIFGLKFDPKRLTVFLVLFVITANLILEKQKIIIN